MFKWQPGVGCHSLLPFLTTSKVVSNFIFVLKVISCLHLNPSVFVGHLDAFFIQRPSPFLLCPSVSFSPSPASFFASLVACVLRFFMLSSTNVFLSLCVCIYWLFFSHWLLTKLVGLWIFTSVTSTILLLVLCVFYPFYHFVSVRIEFFSKGCG